jgi:hypothetical protein
MGIRFFLLPKPFVQIPFPEDWHLKLVAYGDDDGTMVYDFIRGGTEAVGSSVLQNADALPRSFVATQMRSLPNRGELLERLKKTNFREVVYLEDVDEESLRITRPWKPHDVTKLSYKPNRIRFEVDGEAPGFLVLTDVWFPGWKCTVSGEEVKVYRANYTFRAVKVPAGKHMVEFRFEPVSYQRGRIITFVTLGIVSIVSMGLFLARWRRSA